MARHRQGAWNGPECPWCDGSSEMTQHSTIVKLDDTYDLFVCRFGHNLSVPHNRDDTA